MGGCPVHILIKNEDTGHFQLNEEALSSVLLRPDIKDKPVCVLAVAGAFRQGKSFLLNFLLRFCNNRDQENWLGDPSEPLTGFSWSRGSRRQTTGIVAWSEPFIFASSSGEEIAVVLLDTQGTFDTRAAINESIEVFSLAMMSSSVFVYNLVNNIKEDDLMNLQTFTSIAAQSQQNCSSHIFQNLQFLVRDWQFPTETPYGNGQVVLDEKLEDVPTMDQSHQDVRRDLKRCFKAINCYLMPNPGSSITNMANFDGKVADLDKDFVKHLHELVPALLAPDNLVKKEIGGNKINGCDLFKLFKDFTESVTSNDLSTSFFQCTARTSSQVALRAGKELYKEAMNLLVTGVGIFLSKQEMDSKHTNEKNRAIQLYLDENKYGRINETILKEYHEELIDDIEDQFTKFSELMDAKNSHEACTVSEVAMYVGKESYSEAMNTLINDGNIFLSEQNMESEHDEEKQKALQLYLNTNTFECPNQSTTIEYRNRLIEKIDELFTDFSELMKCKNNNETRKICEDALCEPISYYKKSMEGLEGSSILYVDPEVMDDTHANEKRAAEELYLTNVEFDWINASIVEQYKAKLGQEIDEQFHEFTKRMNFIHAKRLKMIKGALIMGVGVATSFVALAPATAAAGGSEILTAALAVIPKLAKLV